ncbi:hypothetical protein SNEBB_003698 [Seison nebaliae]|nr:hypothetical protein SNEBB_003698 [Seison nebaliae]
MSKRSLKKDQILQKMIGVIDEKWTSAELVALNGLHERMIDTLPAHRKTDNYYLYRWLKARNFDVDKAEIMLRNHLEWRKMGKVDDILMNYEKNEILERYYAGGICGRGKDGSLVWYDPFGMIDMKGIMRSVAKSQIIRMKIHLLEYMNYRLAQLTKEENRSITKIIVIFDLRNASMGHLWKPGLQLFNEIVTLFETHYPETLSKTFVINAPKVFPFLYQAVKPFLDEGTRKKVTVCGKSFLDDLLQFINQDQIPKYYGGTLVDKDGDENCSEFICWGGKVPEKFFSQKVKDDQLESTTIPHGNYLDIYILVQDIGSTIKWIFQSQDCDIGFSVHRIIGKSPIEIDEEDESEIRIVETRLLTGRDNKGLKLHDLVQYSRTQSQLIPEEGSLKIEKKGIILIRFDNSYSWIKNKLINYKIELFNRNKEIVSRGKLLDDNSSANSDQFNEIIQSKTSSLSTTITTPIPSTTINTPPILSTTISTPPIPSTTINTTPTQTASISLNSTNTTNTIGNMVTNNENNMSDDGN